MNSACGKPRFDDDFVAAYTNQVANRGGAVTWDVPIDDYGHIPDEYIRQLTVTGERVHK